MSEFVECMVVVGFFLVDVELLLLMICLIFWI